MFYICCDFNIHVDVPIGDSHKFMIFFTCIFLNSRLVNLLISMVPYLISFYPPNDRDTNFDVKIDDFISDHAIAKCSLAYPCAVWSDLKNTPFVKFPANSVFDLY